MLEETLDKLVEAIEKMTGVLAGLSLVPPEASKAQEEKPKATRGKAKKDEPKAEEPKAEEPKAEEPKAEEPKAEAPKVENSAPVTQQLADQAAATAKDKIRAGLIKISETKGDGIAYDILTRFGGAKKLSDIPVENYAVIIKELEAQGGF